MKSHGLEMVGELILEKVSSLPSFDSGRDPGRILYVEGDEEVFVGKATEWGNVGAGGLQWETISTSTSGESGSGYLIDATSNDVTLTLPSSGDVEVGDQIAVCDVYNYAETNEIIIDRNGSNIEGIAENLNLDYNGSGITLVYTDDTRGWEIVNQISGGTSLSYASTDNAGIIELATSDEAVSGTNSSKAMTPESSSLSSSLIMASAPAHYSRDVKWKVKGNDTAANRYTLVSPNHLTVNINQNGYVLNSSVEIDLSNSSNWDDTSTTDWTVSSNRAGTDFYIYVVEPSSGYAPEFILSNNSTVPDGYTENDSRKIGGFHCVCADIGANTYAFDNSRSNVSILDQFMGTHGITTSTTQHWLEGFLQGDIIPFSIWDLSHRPKMEPEGSTYDPRYGIWAHIYLPSWNGNLIESAYNATVADGDNGWHQYRFSQQAGEQKATIPNQIEFVSLSIGSPQGVNISGSADPGTTGGHTASDGNRIVSLIGVEDACGVYWQWGREGGATNDVGSSWSNAFDGNDLNVAGEHYEAPNRPRFGGAWLSGSECGSRGSSWNDPALTLGAFRSSRFVSPGLSHGVT